MKKIKKVKNKTDYSLKKHETIKRVNDVISKEKNRKGLWKTKNEIQNEKYNAYCKENGIQNTSGGWKNRKWCSTKSQWQWKIEDEISQGTYKEDKKPVVKIKTHEAVILYDEETGNCDAYEAEVEKINDDITVKIPYGKKKLRIKVYKGEIDNEEIIGIALENMAQIYIIDEIEGEEE